MRVSALTDAGISGLGYLFRALPNWEEAHVTTCRPSSPDPARHRDACPARHGAIAAQAASADTQTVGLGGWQVQSSAQATQSPQQISTPGFRDGLVAARRPDDAGAVGTEVGALVQTGHCPDVFFSTNMKTCFGYMDTVGADTIPEFSVPWWFRTDFFAQASGSGRAGSQSTDLIVNGVVGQADVWVNGQRGRDAGHRAGRLHPVHVRHHRPASARR